MLHVLKMTNLQKKLSSNFHSPNDQILSPPTGQTGKSFPLYVRGAKKKTQDFGLQCLTLLTLIRQRGANMPPRFSNDYSSGT